MGYLDEFNDLIQDIDLYNVYFSGDANEFKQCTAEENAKTKIAIGLGLE